MVDALPQCFERGDEHGLVLHNIRQVRRMHFFKGFLEALIADRIHRKEAECLSQRHTVCACVPVTNRWHLRDCENYQPL